MRSIVGKFRKKSGRYKKFVIWGERSPNIDSFRYIMHHYYDTLRKLNIPAIWVDDTKENLQLVESGDLVIAANVTGRNLRLKKNVYYCLHNFDRELYRDINKKFRLVLQVYNRDADKGTEKWDPVTRFDRKDKILYQPWGTNLLPWEFMSPVAQEKSRFVFWVGSIWDNEQHQGNLGVIKDLKGSLKKYGIYFVHLRVPDLLSIKFMRYSRIAPAFGGLWQAKVNYMPCRVFKNIPYGQLGITNIPKFKELLGDSFLNGNSIEEWVEAAMNLSSFEYKEMVLAQQEKIKSQTYLHKLLNIMTALEE